MDRFKLTTPFCGTGNLRSVAITAGFVYLVGLVYSTLDYVAVLLLSFIVRGHSLDSTYCNERSSL